MTRVQFYLIDSDDPAEQLSYALQLALQLLAMGKYLHIHTSSEQRTLEIREFIADRLSSGQEKLSIDHRGEPENQRDVLLNLSDEVPACFSSFESTLEVVCKGGDGKELGRERYRYYQSRGYPLQHTEVASQLAL